MSLFSTYRQGENRVTASMLAVLSRLDISRLERLLSAIVGEASLQVVAFENQPTTSASPTIPDGRIHADFSLWIETKTSRNAISEDQLRGHLAHLGTDPTRFDRLLVVTPDAEEPPAITRLADSRLIWTSFAAICDAIDDVLADPSEVVSERELLLLRELEEMLDEDGLLTPPTDVAIVAAGIAYDEYLRRGVYKYQAGRSFRPIEYLGFYRQKRIEPHIPRVLRRYDSLRFVPDTVEELRTGDELDRRAADVIDAYLREGHDQAMHSLMLLTPPDHPDTIHLDQPIIHHARGAWTQHQRYARSEDLHTAHTTDELS